MKRLIVATLLLVPMTAPAFAQASRDDDPIIMQDKNRKKEAEEVDKQYTRTLDKTSKPTTGVRADPWSNMRGPADDPKTTKR